VRICNTILKNMILDGKKIAGEIYEDLKIQI
jgi:hypothetical protein